VDVRSRFADRSGVLAARSECLDEEVMRTYAIDLEAWLDFCFDCRISGIGDDGLSRDAADARELRKFARKARRDDSDAGWRETAHRNLFAEERGGSPADLDGAHALRHCEPGWGRQQHDLPLRGHVCGE